MSLASLITSYIPPTLGPINFKFHVTSAIISVQIIVPFIRLPKYLNHFVYMFVSSSKPLVETAVATRVTMITTCA